MLEPQPKGFTDDSHYLIDTSKDTVESLREFRCWWCNCDVFPLIKESWVFRIGYGNTWDNRFINLSCHPCMVNEISPRERGLIANGSNIWLHTWNIYGLIQTKLTPRKDGPNLYDAWRVLKEEIGPMHRRRAIRKSKDKPKVETKAKVPIPSGKKITHSLRFEIFKRDNYRCRICGAASRDGDHVRLEVDHITPRSKGGTDDITNLWVLCFRCNRGKGTKEL